MLKGIRKWLTMATVATLTLTLLPLDGRCQESGSVFDVLMELARPQKPKKPKVVGVTTPNCPMGVCTGNTCPEYCPAVYGQCSPSRGNSTSCPLCTTIITGVADTSASEQPASPCTPCTPGTSACTRCQEGKVCGQDCPQGCGGDCAACPGCAVDRCPMGRCTQAVEVDYAYPVKVCTDQRYASLHHLCLEQEQTIHQLAVVMGEMQKEMSALRLEVQMLRNRPIMPQYVVPAPMPMPQPMPYPNPYYQYNFPPNIPCVPPPPVCPPACVTGSKPVAPMRTIERVPAPKPVNVAPTPSSPEQ
jgi:uncharacterized coiled-coil protein SlyX